MKKEIKNLIKTDNFSIVKFKRGSLTVVITLQYIILREIKKNYNFLCDSFFKNINSEVQNFVRKFKDYEFASLGNTKPDYVDKEILDITNEENKKQLAIKMKRMLNNGNNNDINILEASKNIKMEDLEKFINNISLKADEQQKNIKRFLEKTKKYNKLFDEEIEKALKKSVFEYIIIYNLVIEKDDSLYVREKDKCKNIEERFLFHGTNIDAVTGILSTQFRNAKTHIFGQGSYFTDILDYAWFYSGENKKNYRNIPKVGDTFTCVTSAIYYDKTKVEKLLNPKLIYQNLIVPKNGIRCAFANYETRLMDINTLQRFNGFIGNEYLITDKSQILPLYGITLKRVEYLVIWRDINFGKKNSNQYDENKFHKIQEFHREIKKYIRRELNTNAYFIESNEEALELVERKKYNKLIIITNGNNNGKEFIIQARRIIGSNTIAAVTTYNVYEHINWVKNMENVLILNGSYFHEKFFNCIKSNNKNLYNQLRNEIINYYNNNKFEFYLNEASPNLFNFTNFKNSGTFKELNFNLNKDSGLNQNKNDESNNIMNNEFNENMRNADMNLKNNNITVFHLFGDGSLYEGDLVNNKLEGNGTMYYSNGNIYSGEWKNGIREGYGQFYFCTGGIYKGEFKNNIIDGYGVLSAGNGKERVEFEGTLIIRCLDNPNFDVFHFLYH